MTFGKFFLGLTVVLFTVSAVAQQGRGQFVLVDQRTQIPVMSCAIQPNWMAGGKATWTTEPACPVSWYAWSMSPDQKVKLIVSSLTVLASPTQIRQVPFLQNPQILANTFLQGIIKDHNLSNVRIADAHFNQHKPDQNLRNSRIQMAREHGIKPTNFYFTELFIRYEGQRNGANYSAIISLPMLATENRPTMMSFSTVVELLAPMSLSCPSGQETKTLKQLEAMVKSLQLNPKFTAIVNQIAAQRTANWIRVQNEIRNEQFKLAESTSTTHERVRDMWSEYIRDVDKVSNPNTGEKMFVDNRYDHAWINNNGEVLYHNSGFNTPNASTATFDPNSNALFNQSNWSKLK